MFFLGIGNKLRDIDDTYKEAQSKINTAHGKIDDLLDSLNTELYPKLDGLQVQSSAGLANTSTMSMAL